MVDNQLEYMDDPLLPQLVIHSHVVRYLVHNVCHSGEHS
jgi:hypothetical protein